MSIRWRLLITLLQLAVLVAATYIATGSPYSGDTWFAAGLFAVVINPQLLEPFYSRPADVIGNSTISLLLYLTTDKIYAEPGWTFLAVLLLVVLVLSTFSITFGAGRPHGPPVSLARATTIISREATALRIYSAVFWLSLIETFHSLDFPFWTLGLAWAGIVTLGSVNWQKVWWTLTGTLENCIVEGMVGPSQLLVTASTIPEPGSWVSLRSRTMQVNGVVTTRIRRTDDVWGQIHIASKQDCEALLQSHDIHLSSTEVFELPVVGSVDADSTDTSLCFCPTRPLEIGSVISVGDGETDILYQLSSAKVKQTNIKGGAHLQVWAYATQLGRFDAENLTFRRHRWAPNPGAAIVSSSLVELEVDPSRIPSSWLQLGDVLGTEIPVFMDIEAAAGGHVAILGMTKMGKTSLACRLADSFAKDRIVTVLDQTGEYKSKRNLDTYHESHDLSCPGISVLEPAPGEVAADKALEYLRKIMQRAGDEYKSGSPTPRVVLVDEAHQFVPEPAILGFKAPGRDSAVRFGLYMMQIRKYGITVVLVSQRTAVVAKSALSQCENIIAFRSVDQTGLGYLEAIAGSEVRDILPRLDQGEALVFGPAISSDAPVAIRVSYQQEEVSSGDF